MGKNSQDLFRYEESSFFDFYWQEWTSRGMKSPSSSKHCLCSKDVRNVSNIHFGIQIYCCC